MFFRVAALLALLNIYGSADSWTLVGMSFDSRNPEDKITVKKKAEVNVSLRNTPSSFENSFHQAQPYDERRNKVDDKELFNYDDTEKDEGLSGESALKENQNNQLKQSYHNKVLRNRQNNVSNELEVEKRNNPNTLNVDRSDHKDKLHDSKEDRVNFSDGEAKGIFGFFDYDRLFPKTTRAPYVDRLALIHSILRAKVEKVANESNYWVHKGSNVFHHSGEEAAEKVSYYIRKFGHKLVDFVEKVHEWEEWKKGLTEALANKHSHEWDSHHEIFNMYHNLYKTLYQTIHNLKPSSGSNENH